MARGRASTRRTVKRINYAESDDGNSDSDSASSAGIHTDDEDEDEEDSDGEPELPSMRNRRRRLPKSDPLKARTVKKIVKPNIGNRTVKRVNTTIPVIPLRRRTQEHSEAKTPYELARERLHVSAVPESLPCREPEFAEIMEYLETAIVGETGTCIYISGVPGTGKTATVLEVIRHLQYKAENSELPSFDFVEINGMKVTDPNQAYSILWECLNRGDGASKARRVTSAHALQLLEARYSKPDKGQKTTVVLMDELDLMVTKKQTVMYNFFEWPNRPSSKLIVVAIANTMDLPERMLTNKISSRLGLKRINFQPYTHYQLYQIVESRLKGIDAFEKEAVEFAARKVSAVSGDARRALDICRRAVEIVESRQDGPKPTPHVTIGIVNDAIQEMLSSPAVNFVQSCAFHQKLFMISVMMCIRRSGVGNIEFADAALLHMQLCRWNHIEPPTTSDLARVCESLGQTHMLVIEAGRMDMGMRMSLDIAEEDIMMGCKNDKVLDKIISKLQSSN